MYLRKLKLQDVPLMISWMHDERVTYGLRTDFQTNLFPGSERLLAIAHTLEEMKTICPCGSKAILVGRYVNGEFTIEGEQVAIDGEKDVTYKSMCAKCYQREKMKLLMRR